MRYKTKLVEIEAIELMESGQNIQEVYDFCGLDTGNFPERGIGIDPSDGHFKITTLEGVMKANLGDFIIRGLQGEYYPCKPEIFHAKYELIGE